MCSDKSGELQNLDKQLFESYQAIKAKLDKNDKKALLDSQKSWLKTREKCESKECLKELLQHRIKELQNYTAHTGNVWLGTYELQQNLYFGWFKIQKCDTNNICEIKYEAILNKSEFNDMHICGEVLMKLEIKNNNKAIAYYDGEEKCRLNLELNKNGILITEQKPKDCYMGCGAGTEISVNSLYRKE
ncbi:MAG: lysozyme inhibitor LprI family protein [Helicobacter sp.]|nr:lysozyme inhibitor LprI family protein [Helicobacter sp.]